MLISAGVVLILCAVVLFSVKDDGGGKKPVEAEKVEAVPRADDNARIEDLVHFDSDTESIVQYQGGSNVLSFAKYLFVFIMIILALLYTKKTLSPLLREHRMTSSGLTEKEYQEICVETLRPELESALAKVLVGAFAPAFVGKSDSQAPDTGEPFEQTMNGIIKKYGLPSVNAAISLCSEAEQKYNPNIEDRVFNSTNKPASLRLSGQP